MCLVKEHIGLQSQTKYKTSTLKVEDPLIDYFHTYVFELAKNNTEIYEIVFGRKIIPMDQVTNCMNWTNISKDWQR